ncbi:MAG: hypothetical protein SFV22_08805, partial [Saprospiraceae bacterium]|nr:hypothetical protein [Saprospiraceae bacterium]
MQKLSDYQGAYEGERMIEGNNFHLDFRMSIREDNNGDFGIEFKDILSGDIYAFLDGVKRKL